MDSKLAGKYEEALNDSTSFSRNCKSFWRKKSYWFN